MNAPGPSQPARSSLPVGWIVVLLATIAIAVIFRLQNVVEREALIDYDGAGHFINTVAILDGTLPHPISWSGHHPPLYYAVAAFFVSIAPDALPMHVTLRVLSLAAGIGALVWSWRTLVARCDPLDATLVSVFMGCVPVFVSATSMVGNETLCAFLVTATLAGLLDAPTERRATLRRSLRSGIFGGLATLSKVTGLLAVATAVVNEWLRRRSRRSDAWIASFITLAIPTLLLAPWIVWLLHWNASPLDAFSGKSAFPDLNAAMRAQWEDGRDVFDYLRFPLTVFMDPSHLSPETAGSVFGLLYASAWGDVFQHFFGQRATPVSEAERLVAIAGLVPSALALLGLVQIVRQRRRWAWAFAPLLFLALLCAGFLVNTWRQPAYSIVKASFLLSALLPASILLVAGLDALPRQWHAGLRIFLVALALLSIFTFRVPQWLP